MQQILTLSGKHFNGPNAAMMAYWSTKHWFLIEDLSERMNFCLQWNADVVAKAGLWSGWTIVQSVEFVYNLQALHPSLSLMDGGFCGGIEQRALTQARGMALEEPPTSLTKIKETYIDSPIISGGGGVSKDMSGKRGLEYSAGVFWGIPHRVSERADGDGGSEGGMRM